MYDDDDFVDLGESMADLDELEQMYGKGGKLSKSKTT